MTYPILHSLDLETDQVNEYPLEPFRKGFQVRLMACSRFLPGDPQDPTSWVLSDPADMRAHLQTLEGQAVTGWNLLYDITCLLSAGYREEVEKIRWIDAMHLCRWWLNSQKKEQQHDAWRLQRVAKEEISHVRWVPEWLEHKDTGEYDVRRAAGDASAALLLARLAWGKLTPQQRRSAVIEAGNLLPAATSWVRGIPVRLEEASKARQEALQAMQESEATLGLTKTQLRSPVQLRSILYDAWGLAPEHFTPKNEPSTDKRALTYLADRDDRAIEILRWRKHNTVETKFLSGMERVSEHLGVPIMHPAPRIFSTYTGRYTYSSKARGAEE